MPVNNFADLAPVQLDADDLAFESLAQIAELADMASRLLQSGDLTGCIYLFRRLTAYHGAAVGTLKLIAEREASRQKAEPGR
jgi:hypothetical protein